MTIGTWNTLKMILLTTLLNKRGGSIPDGILNTEELVNIIVSQFKFPI